MHVSLNHMAHMRDPIREAPSIVNDCGTLLRFAKEATDLGNVELATTYYQVLALCVCYLNRFITI